MFKIFGLFTNFGMRQRTIRYDEFIISSNAKEYLKELGFNYDYTNMRILVLQDSKICIFSGPDGILKRVSFNETDKGIEFKIAKW